ncbi:hypothetical protein R80B4_03045 [Fibrobacteres bacterium R8-0-B4]
MQSDPVKNVSLGGLVGFGRSADNAKSVGASDVGAFTAEVKKIMAAAEESGSPVKTAAIGWNAAVEKTAAAVGVSKSAEAGANAGTVNIEELFRLVKLAASAEDDGDLTDGFEDEYAELSQEDKLRAGNELLSHAVKQIAAILGLPDEGGASAKFEFDPANVEQLAAIMSYLDLTIKMANDRIDVSANAESANMAMAAYGMESPIAHIEPEENAAELSEFAAALRTEKFRMDMAFRLIGVSGMISEKMAEQSDAGGEATGIPQAVNPSNLGMSVSDTVSAFSNLIKEELSASADRLRQIARGQAEMTDLERAAVELGTVKSEILKAALGKAKAGDSTFVKSDLNINSIDDSKTDVNTANVKTNVNPEIKTNAGVGINTNTNTGIDTEAKVSVNAANVKTGADTVVNTTVNTANVKTDVNPTVNTTANTANVKTDVNTTVNTDVNTEAKTDVNTANVKTDVNTAADKNVSTDVKTEAKTEAKTDANTANVKTDVNIAADKNVNTDVNTEVKANVNTANVKTDVNTAADKKVNADVINTEVKADVNTAKVKADVNPSVNTNVNKTVNATVNTDVNTEPDVKAEAKSDVDAAAVKADVGSNVDKNIKTANHTNRHEQKTDNVRVNAPIGTNANVKADVNSDVDVTAKADVNIEAEADTDTANVKKADVKAADVKTAVNTTADTDANPEAKAVNNAQKRAVDTDLPISAVDSASRRKRSSVESANRMASKSAERAAAGAKPSSSGDSAEIPLSVMALSHGKKAAKSSDGEAKKTVAEPQTHPQAKSTVADGEATELPTSVTESAEKKPAMMKKAQGGHTNSAKAAASAVSAAIDAATAKAETAAANKAADEAFVAKLKQTIEVSGLTKSVSGKSSGGSSAKSAPEKASANSAASSNNSLNAAESSADADLSVDNGDESESGGTGSVDTSSSRSTATKHAERAETPAVSQDERLEVIRQISEKLNNAVRSGANEIRMTLRPEAMGEVRMSLRIQGDVVFARMQVENKQVKAIVESNLQSLKDSLNRQNLEFGAIDVEVGANSDGDKSPRELWQEMADRAESRGFKPSVAVAPDGTPIDAASDGFVSTLGSDTGRRFGDNTFEYFA